LGDPGQPVGWLITAVSGTAARIAQSVVCHPLLIKRPGFVSRLLMTND
jgi:hypothetical protein